MKRRLVSSPTITLLLATVLSSWQQQTLAFTTSKTTSTCTSTCTFISQRERVILAATATTLDIKVDKDVFCVCGGGPTGLLSAIMLAQKFPEVRYILTDDDH